MSSLPADLDLFVAVCRAGSFSAVARSEGLSVSSVSRRIDALEAELGARLLHRSTRRIRLTEAGSALLERSRPLLASIEALRMEIRGAHTQPTGRLRVSASTSFGHRHVAPIVSAFLDSHRDMTVELRLEDAYVDLIESEVDVAVRIGRLADSQLHQVRLAPLRRIACASPSYLSRFGAPAHPRELAHHACLMVAGGVGREGAWRFKDQGPELLRPRFVTNSPEAAAAAARAGAGIAHLPSWTVAEDIAVGRLVPVLEAFAPPPAPLAGVHLVWLPEPSARVRAFINFFRKQFAASTRAPPR